MTEVPALLSDVTVRRGGRGGAAVTLRGRRLKSLKGGNMRENRENKENLEENYGKSGKMRENVGKGGEDKGKIKGNWAKWRKYAETLRGK